MAGEKKAAKRKYTDISSVWDEIIILIEEGNTLRQICEREGMPAWSGLRGFIRSDERRMTQYAHAREVATEAFEEELLAAARSATFDDANAKRLHVDALKWILAKRAPKVYGDKITQEHPGTAGKELKIPTLMIMPFDKNEQSDED